MVRWPRGHPSEREHQITAGRGILGGVFCIASCTSQTPSLGAGVPIRKRMETPPRNAVLLSKQNTFLCKILMKSTHSPGKILVQLSLIFQIKKKEKRLGNFQVF